MKQPSLFLLPKPALTPTDRKQLSFLIAAAAGTQKTNTAQNSAYAKAKRQLDALADEIAALESSIDAADLAACQRLAGKKEQHALLSKRLPTAPPPLRDDASAVHAFKQLRTSLSRFFKTYLDGLIDEWAGLIAPLYTENGCTDPQGHARDLAKNCNLLTAFSRRYIVGMREQSGNGHTAPEIIALAETLLSKRHPFPGNEI